MLTKPNLKDEEIVICLQDAYGLTVQTISFLPLGADPNTFVYRVTTNNQTNYFLKLRRGEFNESAVLVPTYLADHGLNQIIPSLPTKKGQLWTELTPFKVILCPYIEGRNSVEAPLSDQQWIEFGTTLKRFHTANIPLMIARNIPQETFSSRWRETVKAFLTRIVHDEVFQEPVAQAMALFLQSKSKEIFNLVKRAEELAQVLQQQPLDSIVCHADIHGWNLLIDQQGALYIVDWDTLIIAPKERDLMFIGAGLGNSSRTPLEEEALFYQGYGKTTINQDAIAYYRYERIIEDVVAYCEQIFLSDEGGLDRIQSFEYLKSNFLPGGTLERAYHSDTVRKRNSQ